MDKTNFTKAVVPCTTWGKWRYAATGTGRILL